MVERDIARIHCVSLATTLKHIHIRCAAYLDENGMEVVDLLKSIYQRSQHHQKQRSRAQAKLLQTTHWKMMIPAPAVRDTRPIVLWHQFRGHSLLSFDGLGALLPSWQGRKHIAVGQPTIAGQRTM